MPVKFVRLKDSGHFDGEAKVSEDKSRLDKAVLMVYTGKFESMDGPVEIKDEDIEKLASNHNGFMSKLGRLASGDVHPRHNPPLQLDHSTSARDTVGRLVGDLSVGEHTLEDGKKVKALMGTARVLGKENVEKVEDGRWAHLSGGFDLENHKVSELTITPFPAAAEAHMLSRSSRMADKVVKSVSYEGKSITVKQDPSNDEEFLGYVDGKQVCSYGDVESCIETCKERIDNRKMSRLMEKTTYKDEEYRVYKSADADWHWETRYHAGICKTKDEANAEAKADIDEFKVKHPQLSSEDTMGYKDLKEKAALYEKCRKHLTEHKKMSEEDADKHLEAAKHEELTAMSEEHDKELKHLAEKEEVEKVEKEKLAAQMTAHKPALVKLAKSMKDSGAKVRLAESASKIRVRLGKLRASAKITPAEIKGIKIDDLASKSDDVINAALSSYEGRQPVIDTGLYGSTKAMSPANLAGSLKKLNMEREELQTRLNMPSKREGALKRLAEIEEQEKHFGDPAHEAPHHEHDGDDAHFEAAYLEHGRLVGEGKHDEAKEHLKSYMKTLQAHHMGEAGHVEDPTPSMSALAAEVKSMQNEFTEFVKLTAPAFGATVEELT